MSQSNKFEKYKKVSKCGEKINYWSLSPLDLAKDKNIDFGVPAVGILFMPNGIIRNGRPLCCDGTLRMHLRWVPTKK